MDLNNLPAWDFDLDDYIEEVEEDEDKRPPLLGKAWYVPPGLYDQPWSEVCDAYGEATLTPYYIEGLASDNQGDRDFASYGLYSATTHQGTVYDASGMAIPFLVDMIIHAEKEHPEVLASHFLRRIAVGEEYFVLNPDDLKIARTRKSHYEIVNYIPVLKEYYRETECPEIEQLLCFYKNILPDYITINHADPIRQASALIAQGFIAAERKLKKHIEQVRIYMYESNSLLVRAAAAVCLAYSDEADEDVLQLLYHLSKQDFGFAPWSWSTVPELALEAWLYAVDMETLLNQWNDDPFKQLLEAIKREFSCSRKKPYLYEELSPLQIRILKECLRRMPTSLNNFQLTGFFLPDNPYALRRLLNESDECLCSEIRISYNEITTYPAWYLMELWMEDETSMEREVLIRALSSIDVWSLANEVYKKDRCTLSLHLPFVGEEAENVKKAKLISVFADALYSQTESVSEFLSQQLETYKLQGKIQHLSLTAISLLAWARKGKLTPDYFKLVRSHHRFIKFTPYTPYILSELLSYTTPDHQKEIIQDVELYSYMDGFIFVKKYGWILLKSCQGDWVINKLEDAINAWRKAEKENPGKIPGDAFPYRDAVRIVKNQPLVEKDFINNLPRF